MTPYSELSCISELGNRVWILSATKRFFYSTLPLSHKTEQIFYYLVGQQKTQKQSWACITDGDIRNACDRGKIDYYLNKRIWEIIVSIFFFIVWNKNIPPIWNLQEICNANWINSFFSGKTISSRSNRDHIVPWTLKPLSIQALC